MDRIYAVTTCLKPTEELEAYLAEYLPYYNCVQRRVFQDLTHGVLVTMKKSNYVTGICRQYSMLKRSVNSIVNDMTGRIKAYEELKKVELEELKNKIQSVENEIKEKEEKVKKLKPLAAANGLSEKDLQEYRKLKSSLYFQRNRLNQMNQNKKKLEKAVAGDCVSICFGTKKFYRKQYELEKNGYRSHTGWHNDFVKKRDSGIFFLGAGCEKCGNQILQLRCTGSDFTMVLLKDRKFRAKEFESIVLEHIRFPYMQKELQEAIQNGQPVSYRISRRGHRWYLTAMFRKDVPLKTFRANGVFGVDYNSGFLEVAETDFCGNLISGMHIPLDFHGTGNRAESELKEKLSKFVRHARDAMKDIVVEDLSFIKKKAKTRKAKSKKGKKYNTMIHLFDYSRFLFWMENLCAKYGVGLTKVNPAYTSKIGNKKYAKPRKLTVHRAAALVIARRGQGFQDAA